MRNLEKMKKLNEAIPVNFKLFGSTITVVFDKKKLKKENCIGLSEYSKYEITLTDKNLEGRELSADVIIDAFYHEKVHMILDAMHEDKLSSNEKFVDVFAKLLRQSEETQENI